MGEWGDTCSSKAIIKPGKDAIVSIFALIELSAAVLYTTKKFIHHIYDNEGRACEVELEWLVWHTLFGKSIGCHRGSLRVVRDKRLAGVFSPSLFALHGFFDHPPPHASGRPPGVTAQGLHP